ncbi:MAG: serine hydrolase domain-containing protein, partial [Hyphococcus sp.]
GLLIAAGAVACYAYIQSQDRYPPEEWRDATCKSADGLENGEARAKPADKFLVDALRADKGAGVAAAVVIDGKLAWSNAAGRARVPGRRPLTPKTPMRLGSVSKPITAALALKIQEAGLLNIDAPIQTYVPEFPEQSKPVTIRLLATHQSGLRHYDFSNFAEANSQAHYERLGDALHLFQDDALISQPGEETNYSSFGYNLIGAAIENATGHTFQEALATYIAEPLSLWSIATDDPRRTIPCRARFYTVYFGQFLAPTLWRDHSEAYSSAGLLASAEDLATLVHGMFEGDHFEEQSKSLFASRARTSDGAVTDRTFGWRANADGDGSIAYYSHGGATNGAYAVVHYYPRDKTAIVAIANYNVWMTDRPPAFFDLMTEDLPHLFIEDAE